MREETKKVIVSVTTTIPTKSAFVWWPAEVEVSADLDDAEAMDEIMAALIEDGLIRVTKLELEHGPGQERRVASRSEVILGINAVATITPMHLRIAEE